MPNQDNSELVKYLKASLLLQISALNSDKDDEGQKMEVLLHRAGFAHKEIAELLGKSYPAVQKAIERSK